MCYKTYDVLILKPQSAGPDDLFSFEFLRILGSPEQELALTTYVKA